MYKYEEKNNNWVKVTLNDGSEEYGKKGEVLDTLRNRNDGRIRVSRNYIFQEYASEYHKQIFKAISDDLAIEVCFNALDDAHRRQWTVDKLKGVKNLSFVEMLIVENLVNPEEYEKPLDRYGREIDLYHVQTNLYYKDIIRAYEAENKDHEDVVSLLEKELAIYLLAKKRNEKNCEYPSIKSFLHDLSPLEREFVRRALFIHLEKVEKEFKTKLANIH